LETVQPTVSKESEEYGRMLAEIEKLMKRDEGSLTSAEKKLLDVMFAAVQEYERKKYTRVAKSTPAEMLAFLIQENNLTQAQIPLLPNRVSEILSGKRRISKDQAKQLAKFFRVSPALFI
jgi:HTH-type transcriptional regulator/antitoxin HigA